MIPSNYHDSDGFKLQFEANCSESDQKFFMQQYPRVDSVVDKRLHCTSCDAHIGTAPARDETVHTHQILAVTQCQTCFMFYNSGEFEKGEDGYEYYCRWCGQGGHVFCCSTCCFVFCNKCIRSNLSKAYVKEIKENEDWSCFVCNKDILKGHRAQHWAFRNFMNKQLEKIKQSDVKDNLLKDDSKCCSYRKLKTTGIPVSTNGRRSQAINAKRVKKPQTKDTHVQCQSKPRLSSTKMDFPTSNDSRKSKPSLVQSPLLFRITKGKLIKLRKQTLPGLSGQLNRAAPKSTASAQLGSSKLPVANRDQSNTPLGIAKTEVENVLKKFLKQSKSYSDLKDLFIYVESLFSEKLNNLKKANLKTETENVITIEKVPNGTGDNNTGGTEKHTCITKAISGIEKVSLSENFLPAPPKLPFDNETNRGKEEKKNLPVSVDGEQKTVAGETADKISTSEDQQELSVANPLPVPFFPKQDKRRKSLLQTVLTPKQSPLLATSPQVPNMTNILLESIRKGVSLKNRKRNPPQPRETTPNLVSDATEVFKKALAHRRTVFRGDSMSPTCNQNLNDSEWWSE